jgi:hypothetical protein
MGERTQDIRRDLNFETETVVEYNFGLMIQFVLLRIGV